jgi:hypothetical protein
LARIATFAGVPKISHPRDFRFNHFTSFNSINSLLSILYLSSTHTLFELGNLTDASQPSECAGSSALDVITVTSEAFSPCLIDIN